MDFSIGRTMAEELPFIPLYDYRKMLDPNFSVEEYMAEHRKWKEKEKKDGNNLPKSFRKFNSTRHIQATSQRYSKKRWKDMNNSSSNKIPNNSTADCPFCGHRNTVRKDNLLYFSDTLVPKGIYCSKCGHFIPQAYFSSAIPNNSSTMYGWKLR